METKQNDGGQAFPMVDVLIDGQSIGASGMTLLDYFAGQALIGIMAHDPLENAYVMARDCYMIAAAMIETRSK